MPDEPTTLIWNFDSAISLLNSLTSSSQVSTTNQGHIVSSQEDKSRDDIGLGEFGQIWDFLGLSHELNGHTSENLFLGPLESEADADQLSKAVRWRDEVDGADLEDNAGPTASPGIHKRSVRKPRASQKRVERLASRNNMLSDTGTDFESGEELESLRRSPDRRSVIDSILGRPRPRLRDANSPPTSPSPPKAELRTPKKNWPVSNPFIWSTIDTPGSIYSPSHRLSITPRDGLTSSSRKQALLSKLTKYFPDERRYLQNAGLLEPAFTPLNISNIGIHVFIDISNISIGFHDCLKIARDVPRETHVRRVPLNFHNFSLVLERGRPAAKRVLVGSDRFSAITQAKTLGYETNILERVHKAKETTMPAKRSHKNLRSGGEVTTSGSETTTNRVAGSTTMTEKWVEQAVDEILHLKILESLIDAERPGTIVLATGDAAEAEYSGGFMRMVERALEKGWQIELVSFKLNTSSLYRRREFRNKWGPMFKWIQLDDFAEMLIDEFDD